MAKPKRKTLTLKNPEYQPSKAELEEEIKIDIPGDTPEKKMKNLSDIIFDKPLTPDLGHSMDANFKNRTFIHRDLNNAA